MKQRPELKRLAVKVKSVFRKKFKENVPLEECLEVAKELQERGTAYLLQPTREASVKKRASGGYFKYLKERTGIKRQDRLGSSRRRRK